MKKPKEKVVTPRLSPKEKLGLSIQDVVELSSLGETTICKAIKDKRLKSRKCGTRTVILSADLNEFLESLPGK